MSRRESYYWKCDRPAAFFGTGSNSRSGEVPDELLRRALWDHFHPDTLTLAPAAGQGNHLTWVAEIDGAPLFIRVENGPEGDDYLEMESAVLGEVAKTGVPVPQVHGCDASRTHVPFAWQALERIPFADLNQWQKAGTLNADRVAFEIGQNLARWQGIQPAGFGSFDLTAWREGKGLCGWHDDYPTYFRLRLETHLDFLEANAFLTGSRRLEIARSIEAHADLLELDQGCLVHKDLALWNILGSENHIAAFIDFDDVVSGDPMDDFSLLGCFHDSLFLERAVAGYTTLRPLPNNHLRRFWLHLLRNLIVKAVIRVGAGYFDRDDGFFLIGSGGSGATLKQFTEQRLATALRGLSEDADFSIL
ncbi:MAG: aminoglycoside phosphotransferase family protein [Verrucomicrobiales bacterium]|nr:aminoglycoside phosphotransferase family protein [Verrucomicrobiales bacterium]